MSKKSKWWIVFLMLFVLGGASFFLLKPKNPDVFVEKEISIKQAGSAGDELVRWQDFAGFSFEYPNNLKITEVELEDNKVYSSLEIESAEGGKITLRVYDSQYQSLDDWLEQFEKTNMVERERDVLWENMEAKQINYGAPEKIKTVAIDEKVVYEIEILNEDDRLKETYQQIINSFEFDQTVEAKQEKAEVKTAIETEGVELIEEVIE